MQVFRLVRAGGEDEEVGFFASKQTAMDAGLGDHLLGTGDKDVEWVELPPGNKDWALQREDGSAVFRVEAVDVI